MRRSSPGTETSPWRRSHTQKRSGCSGTGGAGSAADAALDDALQKNPLVPQYLLGRRKLPRRMPDYYSPGDRNEAIIYAACAGRGWAATRGALAWLKSRSARARQQ